MISMVRICTYLLPWSSFPFRSFIFLFRFVAFLVKVLLFPLVSFYLALHTSYFWIRRWFRLVLVQILAGRSIHCQWQSVKKRDVLYSFHPWDKHCQYIWGVRACSFSCLVSVNLSLIMMRECAARAPRKSMNPSADLGTSNQHPCASDFPVNPWLIPRLSWRQKDISRLCFLFPWVSIPPSRAAQLKNRGYPNQSPGPHSSFTIDRETISFWAWHVWNLSRTSKEFEQESSTCLSHSNA